MEKTAQTSRWALWRRQIASILRLEVRKNFTGKRSILIYLLALLPVFIMAALSWIFYDDIRRSFAESSVIFANLYEGMILRTVVFFGCAWIFMNLFRGEVVDRSLHYYFLSPVRREVLVTAKYLSGLVASVLLFVTMTALCVFFIYLPLGYSGAMSQLFDGPGLNQVLTYLGITVLACVGYGAVFLVIGLFFRNPIIPAILLYGWEFINFLLPPMLKKLSVIHYLHSLTPVPINEGPFAIVTEPTSAWLTVPGLILVTAMVLLMASVRIRRMEIKYGGD
ncbi:MAG TPA: ABC transporter permease [Pyrinomonadaceae bacterium]|jgi:ABC-type transport system involved in multi-copper enzyme maturation permease subunit